MVDVLVIHGAGLHMRSKMRLDFSAKYLQPVVVHPMR